MDNPKPFTSLSRNLVTSSPDDLSTERIQASALVRIADAVEIMTQDRVKLERDLDWYKKQYRERGKEIESRDHKIRTLRGVVTKLKNEREKLKETSIGTMSSDTNPTNEPTDEQIRQAWEDQQWKPGSLTPWLMGIKWYREQIGRERVADIPNIMASS